MGLGCNLAAQCSCSSGNRIPRLMHATHALLTHSLHWVCAHLQESQLARDNEAEAVQLAAELPQKHQPLVNKTRYATPASVQMRQLMRRFLLVYWRSPAYNVRPLLWHRLMISTHNSQLSPSLLDMPKLHGCVHAGDEDDHDDLHLAAVCASPWSSCVRCPCLLPFLGCYEHMHAGIDCGCLSNVGYHVPQQGSGAQLASCCTPGILH
jgi:hypothetical protein